jgi:hypothetical protein
MLQPNRLSCSTVVGLALIIAAGVVTAQPSLADARCQAKNKRKIKRYTKAAMDDFDLLEIKSALKKLTRAIDHAEDNDCDETIEYADALLKKGIVHMRGEQDAVRGKLYMRKAIKANACVRLPGNMPPKVQRIWKQIRRSLSRYKCKDGGGGDSGGGDSGGGGTTTAVDYGDPPSKACEHSAIDEVTAGNPVRIIVKVKTNLGAAKVIVFYKPQGEASYQKLRLAKADNGWAWTGLIPSVAVHGQRLAYFIEVQNAGGTAICSPIRATSGQPEIIMVKAGKRTLPSGCTAEMPEEMCKTNPDHPCCKKGGDGGGGGVEPKPPIIKDPKAYPRFYLSAGFALGTGYLSTSMKAFGGDMPHVAGFALGPVGGQIDAGYFLGTQHLLTLVFRLGVSFSGVSESVVLSLLAMLRYRFFVLGGGKKDLFGLYLGPEVGGGVLYHSLKVGSDNEFDTFKHSYMMLGAVVGVQIGTQMVAWYLELDPCVVFPKQSTFHLGFSTGVALRF